MAMSTINQSQRPVPTRPTPAPTNGHGDLKREWEGRTRIFLTPIAAPSILGLFGFASSTFMVAAFLAGWYGQNQGTGPVLSNLAPFCLTFGGLAQFLAGMWSYRARDALGTAAHGTWGAFWLAFAVFFILTGAGALHVVGTSHQAVPFSYWFYTLAVITGCCFVAALRRNLGLAAVLLTLAVGSALVAIGFSSGITTWYRVGGYFLVVSAVTAVYTALSLLLVQANEGREILPLGHWPYWKKESWKPGAIISRPQEYAEGMPGSKIGQ